MKLALIGHGAMGQLVEQLARDANDEIGAILTSRDSASTVAGIAASLKGHDVAIDFTVGDAVAKNVEACVRAGVPLVEGTTGWKDDEAQVRRIVAEHDGALVYGANFSIGVSVFFKLLTQGSPKIRGTHFVATLG